MKVNEIVRRRVREEKILKVQRILLLHTLTVKEA